MKSATRLCSRQARCRSSGTQSRQSEVIAGEDAHFRLWHSSLLISTPTGKSRETIFFNTETAFPPLFHDSGRDVFTWATRYMYCIRTIPYVIYTGPSFADHRSLPRYTCLIASIVINLLCGDM